MYNFLLISVVSPVKFAGESVSLYIVIACLVSLYRLFLAMKKWRVNYSSYLRVREISMIWSRFFCINMRPKSFAVPSHKI